MEEIVLTYILIGLAVVAIILLCYMFYVFNKILISLNYQLTLSNSQNEERVSGLGVQLINLVQETKTELKDLSHISEQKITAKLEASLSGVTSFLESLKASIVDLAIKNDDAKQKMYKGLVDALTNKTDEILSSFLEARSEAFTNSRKLEEQLENVIVQFTNVVSLENKKTAKSLDELKEQVLEIDSELDKNLNRYSSSIFGLIQTLRVANTIQNARNQYENGRIVIEDSSFLKIFDGCMLTEIQDKLTGQSTISQYKNGVIEASRTYHNGMLKYVSSYESGNLKYMDEISDSGKVIAKYTYDEAGEVESLEEF